MDGYLFIMTADGKIYNSDLNASTAWTSTSFLTTKTANQGAGVAFYRNMIAAFGGDYIEFYENVGNATGSPLQHVEHLRVSGDGVAVLANSGQPIAAGENTGHRYFEGANTVYWINNPDLQSGPGVYMLDGFSPRKISSDDVDLDLSRHLATNLKIVGVADFFGYPHLFISTGDQSTDYCWAYNIKLGAWTTWESALLSNFFIMSNSPSTTSGLQNEVLLFSGTKYHKFDIESFLSTDISYTDNGSAYTATIQTRNIDFDNNRKKFWHRFTLIGADSREASATNVSWSDDDGQTWSTARALDMNDARPSTTRLGASRRRQWRITNAADAPFEAEAIELTFSEGTH